MNDIILQFISRASQEPFLESDDEDVESQPELIVFSKTGAAFEMPSAGDVHHCFMVGLGDDCRG